GFRRNFSCSVVLRIHSRENRFSTTGLLPSLMHLSRCFVYSILFYFRLEFLTTPPSKLVVLGSSRFARRYSGNRFFFLFLRVLRCFSSPRLPSIRYVFTYR